MDDRGEIGGGLSLSGSPGIDLRSQQEDEGEVVEEDQDHDREPGHRAIVAWLEEVVLVEREEQLVENQQRRAHQRSLPDFFPVDRAVGDDDVDRAKEDDRHNEGAHDAQRTRQRLIHFAREERLCDRVGGRGGEEEDRHEDDKEQHHREGHDVLVKRVARAQAEDDTQGALDGDEEP